MTALQTQTWSLHQVFVQANLVDGYQYLDRTGIVLNRIRRDFRTLNVVDPNGTSLRDSRKEDGPYALRFSSERIWLQYSPVKSAGHVVSTAPSIIRGIAEDIECHQIDRLGLRSVYYVPSEDADESSFQVATKLLGGPLSSYITKSPRDDLRLSLEIPFISDGMEVIARIRKLDITRSPQTPSDYPKSGLVFDLDVGHRPDDKTFRLAEIPRLTRSASEKTSSILLDLGHSILQGVSL